MKRIEVFFSLSFLESLLALVFLFGIPSESGYSTSRLIMLGVLLILGLFFLSMIIGLRVNRGWAETIDQRLIDLPSNSWWQIVALFSLGFLFGALLLSQWFFVSTDALLNAYLLRLTPLLVFGVIFCAQTILFSGYYARLRGVHKDLAIFLLGFITLLPWLVIGEYYWANQMFPDYYVAEKYVAEYRIVFQVALFMAALYGQTLFFYLRQRMKLRLSGKWFVALAFFVIGVLYYDAAARHADTVNVDPIHSDQQVYISLAKKVRLLNFSYTGARNQTPLYPFLQALFYNPELSNEEYFAVGKQVNIILSLVLLFVLFYIFRCYFSLHRCVILTLIVAFSLFIFKSPYFTAEIMYYSLSFLAFLGMGWMLISPSISTGIYTGIALGFAYYTKATILPAFVLFSIIFITKEIWVITQRGGSQIWGCGARPTPPNLNITAGNPRVPMYIRNWVSFSVVVVVFLGILFPYLQESKNIFGHYFYNQNSTFFIWYDDFYAAKADSELYGYGQHWPDLPPDEIPGFQNYIREHSLRNIVDRFVYGFGVQLNHVKSPYNRISFPLVYLLILALVAAQNIRSAWRNIVKYRFVVGFVILNFIAYIVLFAWYAPVAGGPRFLYTLFVPYMFSVFLAIKKIEKDSQPGARNLRTSLMYQVIDIVVLSMLVANYYLILTSRMPSGYFGS